MTSLMICKFSLLLIAMLYYAWFHWRSGRIEKIRRRRERIAFMLWVASKEDETALTV